MSAYAVRFHPYTWYIEQFQQQQPFTLSRWGDGEWRAVLGADAKKGPGGANCDGHRYFPAMNRELDAILRSQPAYCLAMQPLAERLFGPRIRRYVQQHCPGREWHDARELFNAGWEGNLGQVLKAIGSMPNIVVGPPYLSGLRQIIPVHKLVAVPGKNCFLEIDRLVRETREVLQAAPKPCVVTFAASMPANIMINRLYAEFGQSAFLLNFGSVYDGLLGKRTRKLHSQWNNKANLDALK